MKTGLKALEHNFPFYLPYDTIVKVKYNFRFIKIVVIDTPVAGVLIFLAGLFLLAIWAWPDRGFLARLKQSGRMRDRVYREDALKHIYKGELKSRRPTLESIAGAVGISLNEAARLVAAMTDEGLLVDQAGTPRLTPVGRDSALHTIRAHRLWERYLAEETGYEEADWHSQAEQREHDLTATELDALAARLGHPTYDPHGDPIPQPGGELPSHGGQLLTTLTGDLPARIVHLEDEPPAIYAQLVAEGLHPGQIIRLTEKEPARIRFWTNGDEHVLAPILAGNIYVRPLPAGESPPIDDGRPLTHLPLGQSARVVSLAAGLRGPERRRLLDLGLLPGTEVTAELRSPGGDPTAYRIRGAIIALRAEQARQVKVTSPEAPNINRHMVPEGETGNE
jgi:DtxR family transcriptional regulator, Mn-dependent transcriptional regulator